MLFAHQIDGRDRECIFVLPMGSVVSYFMAEGSCMRLHIEAGLCAYEDEFEADRYAVREAVLAEAARRLGVPLSEVLLLPFERLKAVCDREAVCGNPWGIRRRARNRSASFSR
ncbi:hypothetical protein KKP04_00035 [Rhodomicrobium sp. Az07]|uniref:hypothetical protein n=1 Tax=Rhodomicrobium sp. Az07 TaxID=2839034 RepID=UPI001BEC76FC|nr:hypothetical protein [Rhodomicrobium sp. Az07]MBT3069261.1 hypothetical protein [Rhodomicrobium sp. Az07]